MYLIYVGHVECAHQVAVASVQLKIDFGTRDGVAVHFPVRTTYYSFTISHVPSVLLSTCCLLFVLCFCFFRIAFHVAVSSCHPSFFHWVFFGRSRLSLHKDNVKLSTNHIHLLGAVAAVCQYRYIGFDWSVQSRVFTVYTTCRSVGVIYTRKTTSRYLFWVYKLELFEQ